MKCSVSLTATIITGLVMAGGFGMLGADESSARESSRSCDASLEWMMRPADEFPKAFLAGKIFSQLLAAAGLRNSVRFLVSDGNQINAEYIHDDQEGCSYVGTSTAYLDKFGADESVILATFSHELAHAIQVHAGEADGRGRSQYTQKQIEAHADMIGGQIATRAGYSAELILAGREAMLTCMDIQSKANGMFHPNAQDRWFNHLAYQKWMNNLDASAANTFQPAIGPEVFSPEGALRPSQLIAKNVRKQYLEAILKLQSPLTKADIEHLGWAYCLQKGYGDYCLTELDAALDVIIEPSGIRGVFAQSCGTSSGQDVSEILDKLNNAATGNVVWLVKELYRRASTRSLEIKGISTLPTARELSASISPAAKF